ncbi:MAG TPA: hypothetical protein VFV19_02065 [Candidatus Polarisedimenticolaceae bacterium]|nr:hypothetical protein [Candidatus Polarisedimenticolaceae bacterium]
MTDPDVAVAIDDLERRGVLLAPTAAALRRVATGSLISVREELRFLLWAGVALIAAGAGLLVKVNLERIGPVTVAAVLGAASALCLAWAWRRSPAFTWGETSAEGFALDYVLLLGALLAAADLAFVEVKFTPLGAAWPRHLLVVAVAYGALAFRFDSKTLFSLALTSFAAWRGVSLTRVSVPWDAPVEDRLVVEALICGVIFLGVGGLLERTRRKAHFEPVAAWLGWLLIAGTLMSRILRDVEAYPRVGVTLYAFALAGCGIVLAVFSWEEARIGRFALGVGAMAFGLWGMTADMLEGAGVVVQSLVVIVLAGLTLGAILRAQALMKRRQ